MLTISVFFYRTPLNTNHTQRKKSQMYVFSVNCQLVHFLYLINFHSEQDLNGDENAQISSKDILTSETWGSIFVEGGKLMNTLFGSLVDEYSSLVIAGLDSITG